jgi:hypothetical protein
MWGTVFPALSITQLILFGWVMLSSGVWISIMENSISMPPSLGSTAAKALKKGSDSDVSLQVFFDT